MLAHGFSDEYILRRGTELTREACIKGGTLAEFERTWDVDRELTRFIEEAKDKFARNIWSVNSHTAGLVLKDKQNKEKLNVEISTEIEYRKNSGEKVPSVTLIKSANFDERLFAFKFVEEGGGPSRWIQLVDYGDGAVDTNYLFRYEGGYWRRLSANPKTSLLATQISNRYGLSKAHTQKVVSALPDFVQQVDKREFEKSRNRYIKVNNGTVDVQSFLLLEDSPEYGCTSKIDVDYTDRDDLDCPVYMDFLNTMFAQEAINMYDDRTEEQMAEDLELSIRAFEEWMGYTLVQDVVFAVALFLKGKSNTGKNVALEMLSLFHSPENISRVGIAEFNDPVARERLTTALVNICDEIGKKEDFDAMVFKKMVQGGGVTVKKLYENPVNRMVSARLIFAFNDFPQTIEINNSVEKRMLFLSCNNVIPVERQDKFIGQKLAKEKQAIFNRWFRALRRLRDNGGNYTRPHAHNVEIKAFQSQNDAIREFIDGEVAMVGSYINKQGKRIEPAVDHMAVYARFREYMETRGAYRVLTERHFQQRVSEILSQKGLKLIRKKDSSGRPTIAYPIELFPHKNKGEF
jgi:P4 family phage/plasmid primase-like protien